MNRIAPLLLVALLAVVAWFLWQPNPPRDPSLPNSEASSTDQDPGQTGAAATQDSPPPLAQAEGVFGGGRTARPDGLVASAVQVDASFRLRAVDSDGTLVAPATFLVLDHQDRIEWIERDDGILPLGDPGVLRSVAVRANGFWSLPWQSTGQESDTVDLATTIAAAAIDLEVRRDSGGNLHRFQVTWSFQPDLPDLEQVFAALAGADLDSLRTSRKGTELFQTAFRQTDPAAAESQGRDGHFRLEGLPPGPYQWSLSATGCVPESRRIDLAAGQTAHEEIELAVGGGIDGRLVDESGAGIANARVVFEVLENDFAELAMDQVVMRRFAEGATFRFQTTTNAQGRFLLEPVPGRFGHLYAAAPGFLEQRIASVHPEPPSTTAVAEAVLQRGGVLELQVLRAEDGSPVEGARAAWRTQAQGEALINLAGWRRAPLPSDEAGLLVLQPLPAATIQIEVRCPGYAPVLFEHRPQLGIRTQQQVQLFPGLRLIGTVLDAMTQTPIEGVKVQLEAEDEGPGFLGSSLLSGGEGPPSARSQADGTFELTDLAPGHYALVARHSDYALQRGKVLELVAGIDPPEQQILMRSGATLTAVFLGEDGHPVEGRAVMVIESAQGVTASQATDASGEAVFEQLAAGTYQVMSVPEGSNGLESLDREDLDLGMTFVTLGAGEHKRIEIGPGLATASLSGQLRQGGQPVGDIAVTLLGAQGIKTARVDAGGAFAFDKMSPGHYTLFVGEIQAPSFTTAIHIEPGDNQADLDLPGGRLRVHIVHDQDGSPASGVPVTLRNDGALANPVFRSSDAEGIAEFEFLDGGAYALAVGTSAMPIFGANNDLGSVMRQVVIGEGLQQEEVRLQKGATFRVRVLGTDGAPVRGASMFYLDEHGLALSVLSVKTTNSKGVAQLTGLPAGSGRILVKHPEFGQTEFGVQLSAGEVSKKEVTLESGATVWIQVVDGSDQPAPGVMAIILDQRGAPISMLYSLTDTQEVNTAFFTGSEQRLGPLAPGPYTVKLFRLGGTQVRYDLEVPEGVPEIHRRYRYQP